MERGGGELPYEARQPAQMWKGAKSLKAIALKDERTGTYTICENLSAYLSRKVFSVD